jgi:hypothetical protein
MRPDPDPLRHSTSLFALGFWRSLQEHGICNAVSADLDWQEYLRLVDRYREDALMLSALG